ncbi:MAG TPA: efflux RND transporter periplasmic adaptor subunit [Kofleriaceae bacterium]|nr:efflux RND transporter periplasmic adaptor subunit [Kofleriaceae bacterium]
MRAVVAFALLASLPAFSACKKKEEAVLTKAPATAPVKVPLVVAAEAPTPDILTLTGTIAADQRSEVTADTQGKVVAVLVERGQRVKMGQPVVQLDVRSNALSAREAQANLAAARATKQLNDEECKRTQVLLDKGAITKSDYDKQMAQCTSTGEQVSAAQARADMIIKTVADGLVRAPFDGVVTEKSVAPGEWVQPGKTLFTLVDDDPLRIELSVPEASVSKIKRDQKVDLYAVAASDGKVYTAKVSRIGGEIGKSRALIVEATLDPQTDLVPGMFAEAHIIVGETPRPVVPKAAVVQRGKLYHTFVDVKGELVDQIVQVGPATQPDQYAILQGVNKGDKVVANAKADKIADGLKVAE